MSNPPPDPSANPFPQPPQYGQPQSYDPYANPSPAYPRCRAAGTVQIIVGAMGALLAFCLLGAMAMLARGIMTPEQQAELTKLTGSLDALNTLLLAAGGCLGVPGLLLVALGVFVWRGAKKAIIGSIVAVSLLLVLLLAGTLLGLVGGQASLESVLSNGVPIVAMAILLTLLIRALQELSAATQQAPTYEQQWQQYYAQQQMPQQPPQNWPPAQSRPSPENLPPPPMQPA